ncbi:MAG: CCA tRNA nucleotidyltransferase [Bacteroidia bacterium]|nr:CCA tRNA nucleotidyltransferase [Bacteroidia bacterium]
MNVAKAIDKEEVFRIIGKCGEKLGLRTYVIGGYVRDFLMNKKSKDIDIVVLGKGTTLAEAFAKAVNSKEITVYEGFGTALVKTKDLEVEFVGARKENYERHSRKPKVEDGTLEDDQLRRDFTINALSVSLNSDDWGTLFDPFGGLNDLENKIIRTPLDPEITFSDDPLRMLRAVRFATRFGFTIEEKTYKAISATRQRISIVSPERISDELNKMIMLPVPSQAFLHLFKTGLLHIILPELAAMQGVSVHNGIAHKDNFYHTLKVLDNVAALSDNIWLRWVAILHDIAKPLTRRFEEGIGWTFHGHEDRGSKMVPAIFSRLKLPLHDKMQYVKKLVALHQRPIALVNTEVSDSAIRRIVVDAGEDLNDLLLFCKCDITSRNEEKVKQYIRNYTLLQERIIFIESRDNLKNWQPPVSGEVIMQSLGIKPGKLVGEIKNKVREAILDGIIPNEYEPAYEYMLKVSKEILNQ